MKAKVFVLMMGCVMLWSCREERSIESEEVAEQDVPAVVESAAVDEVEPLTDEQLGEWRVQGVKMYKKVNQLYRWRNTVRNKESRIESYPELLAKLPDLGRSLEEKKIRAMRLEQEYMDHLHRTNVIYAEEPSPYPAKRARELIAGFGDELAALKKENAELRERLEKKGEAP